MCVESFMKAVEEKSVLNTMISLRAIKDWHEPRSELGKCTPLEYALKWNCSDIVECMLEIDKTLCNSRSNFTSPLHEALRAEDDKIISILLAAGADFAVTDGEGHTPLHVSSRFETPYAAKIFLKAGADINQQMSDGRTPLLIAVQHQRVLTVVSLIKRNADLNIACIYGDTPLHIACQLNDYEMARLLIFHGAKTKIKNNTGKMPIDCTTHQDILEILRDGE